MVNSNTKKAVLALIAANMIWGAAAPVFKWALADIHPYTLAFLRFSVPLFLMYPFVRGKLKINKKDFLNIILIGVTGIGINIIFFFQGLLHAPSINAALIGSSGPIFIILYSLLFLKEKPNKKLVLGAHVGLFGIILVLATPFIIDGKLAAIGNVFYLFAMLGAVTSVLITRNVAKRNSPESITFWSFLVGSIVFFPFFINEVHTFGFLQNLNARGIIGLTFGILLCSLTAYFLQNWALKYLAAADVSVFTYIDPVVAILIAAPLLGEFPDIAFVFGSLFVLGGIFIAEGRLHYHPLHRLFK
jgi:drug/metabolite transporter (DMT)-like permease